MKKFFYLLSLTIFMFIFNSCGTIIIRECPRGHCRNGKCMYGQKRQKTLKIKKHKTQLLREPHTKRIKKNRRKQKLLKDEVVIKKHTKKIKIKIKTEKKREKKIIKKEQEDIQRETKKVKKISK